MPPSSPSPSPSPSSSSPSPSPSPSILTGLIIFVRPGTNTQLAVGFAISIFFFCLHVKTNAYIADIEDELQFCALLSICLTLFGGLALKANEETTLEEKDPAESALMAILLVVINVGVVVLMLYQCFLTFRKPPPSSQTKLQRAICAKLFDAVFEQYENPIMDALAEQGLDEQASAAVKHGLRELARVIPIALDAVDNVAGIIEELQGVSSCGDALDIFDMLLKLAKQIMGPPAVIKLIKPFTDYANKQVLEYLESLGAPEAVRDACIGLVDKLPSVLVKGGMKTFTLMFMSLTDITDIGSLGDKLASITELAD